MDVKKTSAQKRRAKRKEKKAASEKKAEPPTKPAVKEEEQKQNEAVLVAAAAAAADPSKENNEKETEKEAEADRRKISKAIATLMDDEQKPMTARFRRKEALWNHFIHLNLKTSLGYLGHDAMARGLVHAAMEIEDDDKSEIAVSQLTACELGRFEEQRLPIFRYLYEYMKSKWGKYDGQPHLVERDAFRAARFVNPLFPCPADEPELTYGAVFEMAYWTRPRFDVIRDALERISRFREISTEYIEYDADATRVFKCRPTVFAACRSLPSPTALLRLAGTLDRADLVRKVFASAQCCEWDDRKQQWGEFKAKPLDGLTEFDFRAHFLANAESFLKSFSTTECAQRLELILSSMNRTKCGDFDTLVRVLDLVSKTHAALLLYLPDAFTITNSHSIFDRRSMSKPNIHAPHAHLDLAKLFVEQLTQYRRTVEESMACLRRTTECMPLATIISVAGLISIILDYTIETGTHMLHRMISMPRDEPKTHESIRRVRREILNYKVESPKCVAVGAGKANDSSRSIKSEKTEEESAVTTEIAAVSITAGGQTNTKVGVSPTVAATAHGSGL